MKDIDFEKHADFVIERVLNIGRPEDFRWIFEKYGEERIKEVLKNKSYNIDKKSAFFWRRKFNISPVQCTKKP